MAVWSDHFLESLQKNMSQAGKAPVGSKCLLLCSVRNRNIFPMKLGMQIVGFPKHRARKRFGGR